MVQRWGVSTNDQCMLERESDRDERSESWYRRGGVWVWPVRGGGSMCGGEVSVGGGVQQHATNRDHPSGSKHRRAGLRVYSMWEGCVGGSM